MRSKEIRSPGALVAVKPERGRHLSAVSLALGESALSETAWRIRVEAQFRAGFAKLGQVRTAPPASARIPGRVILIACCPGAIGWQFWVEPIRPYDAVLARALVKVDAVDCGGCLPGITPLDGSLLESGGDDAGAYRSAASTAATTVQIPEGSVVDEISVLANSVGDVTVDVLSPVFGALPTTTVRVGTGFTTSPKNLRGPTTIAIAGNVLSSFVAWREVT